MISHQYYPNDRLILNVFYGNVTSEEMSGLIDKLQKIELKEGAIGTMRGLTILSGNVKVNSIKAKEIMNAGERMKNVSFRKNGKNVIVAKTLVSYGLSRMYEVATNIMNLDELKVFKEKEFDEAIEWLEVGYLKEEIQSIIDNCEKT